MVLVGRERIWAFRTPEQRGQRVRNKSVHRCSGGEREKREGPRERYILIKEWRIIFQRTIFQAPRLMTKRGQHPTSHIPHPLSASLPEASASITLPLPPGAASPVGCWAFPWSIITAHQSFTARLGSRCSTGAVLLTSSSPSGMLCPSQEVGFCCGKDGKTFQLQVVKTFQRFNVSTFFVWFCCVFIPSSSPDLINECPHPIQLSFQEGEQVGCKHEHIPASVAVIWWDWWSSFLDHLTAKSRGGSWCAWPCQPLTQG